MWIRRFTVLLVLALAFFGWGISSGVYKFFPYTQIVSVFRPLKKTLGIVQVTGGTLYGGLINIDFKLITGNNPIPGSGGGLTITDKGVLIARRADGVIIRFDPASSTMTALGLRLPPTNRNLMPEKTVSGRPINAEFLRYNDLMVKPWGGVDHMIVSYSYYEPDRQCVVSRLDEAPLPEDWATTAPTQVNWRRLMESTPCLHFKEFRNAFAGNQAAGRLLDLGDDGLLWTVGDYEFDGADAGGPPYPQMDDNSYGKIWHISLPDGAAKMYTMGQRNPQGITRDASGRIWTVEHGPMGGDELNLIRKGTNYGWPYVTLGMQYANRKSDVRSWPLNKQQGRHEGFEPPFYAWLPSVAPSSLQYITGFDPRWDGDLLVSTLIDKSLHRLRLEGDRVLYDERIEVGQRVREIRVGPDHRIYILLDNGGFGYLKARPVAEVNGGSAALAAALSANGCIMCHSNPKLPTLDGIGGTAVASQQGIDYSDALKSAGGVWTEERLRAFLTSPQTFAPGTVMPDPGLNPEAIKALAAALMVKDESVEAN